MNHLNATPKASALERLLGLRRFAVPVSTCPLDALVGVSERDRRVISTARGMAPELRERFLADHPLTTRGGDAR